MIVTNKEIDPIYQISDHCMLAKNGDITFAYLVSLPEIYSLGEREFDNIHSDLFKFVNMLSDCILHKQDVFLESTYEGDNIPKASFLQKATFSKFQNRKYLKHYSFLYFTLPKLKSLDRTYMNISIVRDKNIYKVDRQRIDRFSKEVERAVAVLNSTSYFHLEPLAEHELKGVVRSYMNGYNDGKMTDVIFEDFQIGDNYCSIYALNNIGDLPESVNNCVTDIKMSSDRYTFFKSFLQPLGLDLNCNHIVNEFIFVDDHKERKEELTKKYKQFNMFSKFSPENESGAENLKNYLHQIEEDEKIRLCRSHVNVMVWADSKENLKALDNQVISKFKEVDLTPYVSKYIDYMMYFLASMPGNAGNMAREDTFDTDLMMAVNFLILVSNYRSDDSGMVFNDRRFNIPVLVDDFYKPYKTKQITARNVAIIAPTGSGKSVLLNHITRQSIEMDFRMAGIDLGNSLETIFHLYPEKTAHIQYEEGRPLGLNPFLVRKPSDVTADKIQSLADFCFILWKKDELEAGDERVSMYKVLQDFYGSRPGDLSFPNFHAYVKESKDLLERLDIEKRFFDRDHFVHVTSEYATGMFRSLLDDKNQSFFLSDKQVVCFELENIKDNMDVLPLVFMMIRDVIDNVIFKDKLSDKRIFLEETAKLIKYPIMQKIIDYYFQTIRKHNGGVTIVLQSIDQIPENDFGNALLANTQIYHILKHERGFENLKHRLNLSDHNMNQIFSLANNFSGDQVYTEDFILMGNKGNVYRLEIPPEANLAYMSEKVDKEPLYQEYRRVESMEKAINNLLGKEI